MDERDNKPVRRGVSGGFITSIILVLGALALLIYFVFRGLDRPTELKLDSFLRNLHEDKISEVTKNENPSVVIITGTYRYDNANPKLKRAYTFTYNAEEYHNLKMEYSYFDAAKNPVALPESTLAEIVSKRIQQCNMDTNPDNDIKVGEKNPYETNWWEQWGPTIILFGGAVLICLFLFSRVSGSINSSNNKALEFNKSRARRVNVSKTKFDDVAGADEEKEEMKEIVSYLKEPKKYTRFGAKLPKGIILVGPPGCGKTLLAKAVAGEAGVPFFFISGSDFVEMFVGVGAGRVRDMFKTAKENAPCLVFIDEIDAVGRQRGAGLGGGNDEREQTLNQLLVEMDGFNDNSGIIVMAATNRDDVLDPALLRAGRFDRKITVTYPDRKGREEIFKVHAKGKKISPDVDFAQLAKRTVGFSGADIQNIMNEAAILAVRRNKEMVTIDEVDEAIDRRVAGPAKSSRSLSAHEKEVVAYHEAGHAIIGLRHPHSDKVQKITIIPRGNTGGHVRMTPEEDRFLMTKNELIARIVGYMGGRSSEEVFFDDVSSGASNDIEVATRIARSMVTELGMSSLGPIQYERDTGSVFLGRDYTSMQKNFSSQTAEKIDEEIRKIIDAAHEEAIKIIKDNKEDVILLAKTLMEHEQITAEEIDYLMEHRHLKRDEVAQPEPVEPSPNLEVLEETKKDEEN